jgi:transcriptional regulatory protein LevR
MSSICRRKKPEKITWQSEFDGVLSSSVCGKLIIELLKFLAFERHQLPAPFDQIKEQVKLKQKHEKEHDVAQQCTVAVCCTGEGIMVGVVMP